MQIVISGMVGVGKSTISEKIYQYYKSKLKNKKVFLFNELQYDNPYLIFFYKNRSEWSFLIQMDFLLSRFKNLILERKKNNDITIFDRHFLDDYVFVKSNSIKKDITAFQLNEYFYINEYLSKKAFQKDKPDFFFLLQANYEEVLKRIDKRGRTFEKKDNLNVYWKDMYHAYYLNNEVHKYLKTHTKNFITIDANKTEDEILNDIIFYIDNYFSNINKTEKNIIYREKN